MSSACRYQLGWLTSGPSATLVVRYTVLLVGSYTPVEVLPRFGARSAQPTVLAGHGGPKSRDHLMSPVTASSP